MLEYLKNHLAIIDWFIPRLEVEDNQYRRDLLFKYRILVSISLFGFVDLWAYQILGLDYPPVIRTLFALLHLFCFLVLCVIKYMKLRYEVIASITIGFLISILTAFILTQEVTSASGYTWFINSIAMATLLLGVKAGLATTLITVAITAVTHSIYAKNGLSVPPFWDEATWHHNQLFDKISAQFFSLAMLYFFIKSKKKSEGELIEAKDTVLKQQETIFKSSRLAELGEVAGGIAHEINNPLSIISGNAQRIRRELAQENPDMEKVIRMNDKIDQTCSRMGKIITTLKTFSRDGSADPFEKIDLASLLDEISDLYTEKFKHNQIVFKTTVQDREFKLTGRNVQIYQILTNLINNAFDAIQDAQNKVIEVQVRRNKNSIEISVIDSGKGIPAEIEDKVIQPFFTTKGVGKGTGLGLSIVSDIMEEHGGTLLIDRRYNDSRVTLVFPT